MSIPRVAVRRASIASGLRATRTVAIWALLALVALLTEGLLARVAAQGARSPTPGASLAPAAPGAASATTVPPPAPAGEPTPSASVEDAWRHFYNARFDSAAAITRAFDASQQDDLALRELHSSALLFQLKRLLEPKGRRVPVRACAPCPELVTAFVADFRRARALAQARVKSDPEDLEARFLLGKLDLNYVWLQLGPLGKRTGWNEYWEARRSLDDVLSRQPDHVRARVARAWIDYIVDTRMPWGTEWMLGGGDRQRALRTIREAAASDASFFDHVEAEFALWEMLVRERDLPGATAVARRLAREFPENRDLATFLATQDGIDETP